MELVVERAEKVLVKFILKPTNLTEHLLNLLTSSKVDFRYAQYLHGKLVVADASVLNSSANWNLTSADRNLEFGDYLTIPRLVYKHRCRFNRAFNMQRPFR